MLRWSNGASGTCVLCNNMVESRNHLFFACVFSSEIWRATAQKVYKRKFTTDWQATVTSVCGKWNDRVESFMAKYIFQAAIYILRWERNRRRHGVAKLLASWIIKWIDKQVRNCFSTIRIHAMTKDYKFGLQQEPKCFSL